MRLISVHVCFSLIPHACQNCSDTNNSQNIVSFHKNTLNVKEYLVIYWTLTYLHTTKVLYTTCGSKLYSQLIIFYLINTVCAQQF